MSYKALTNFVDLTDNNHRYLAGDTFPRKGYKPSDERIAELLSDQNKRGEAVIAEEKKKPATKKKQEK